MSLSLNIYKGIGTDVQLLISSYYLVFDLNYFSHPV